jgi:hypothetical protein
MGFTALIAGGVGAIGSIGSALIGSNASKNAATQQINAQLAGLKQQQSMFDTAQGYLEPYINAGKQTIPTLQNLLTPGMSAETLSQMPGFAFASQYGTKAATNAAAAKTGPSAGPLATAISQFNNGLAGTQYFNTVGALQNFVNTGSNAAGSLAGGAINSGNAQASTLGNIGNAGAAGTLGSANALAGGLTGAGNAATNSLLYSAIGGNGIGGGNGLYTPQQIANIGNMPANQITDAQANAYGIANGLV